MTKNEWFRNTSWTPEIRTQFFSYLQRSRGVFHKAQYLRIQAYTLRHEASPCLPEAALELLDLLISEYPDPSQLTSAYLQKAECLEVIGKLQDATQAFLDSFSAEKAYPGAKTNAQIDFAIFVLHHDLRMYYDLALQGLRSNERIAPFPIHQYQVNMALAIFLSEKGDAGEARRYAEMALAAVDKTDSGFRFHRTLGLVDHIDNQLHPKLLKIADGRFT